MSKRIESIEQILESFRIIKTSFTHGFVFPKNSSITPAQGFVLHFIVKKKQSSVKEIAESLRITSSAATQLVEALVQSGFLERKEDLQDRRAVTITLSAIGKKQVAYMREKGMEGMIEVFSSLSDTELETYLRLNQKIAQNIRK